jgi:DNA mismatch repair protein MutS
MFDRRDERGPSILFDEMASVPVDADFEKPQYFADLHMDEVIGLATSGRDEYDLKPFFYERLTTRDAIVYRQEVFLDLENKTLFSHIVSFAEKMSRMRGRLIASEKSYYTYYKHAWFLDAAEQYCDAVTGLAQDLASVDLRSRGFLRFRGYVTDYAQSVRFAALASGAKEVRDKLFAVRYFLNIKEGRVTVSRYEPEADYSADVLRTFGKFKQGAVRDYRANFPTYTGINHIQAQILDLVARLYPDAFVALAGYYQNHRHFVDESVRIFDREIQFYLAYLQFVERFVVAGLKFCYPRVSDRIKEVYAFQTFDIALASKLAAERAPVVCNDFQLTPPERIIVVTGPNQGGKTTFVRMFGQLHHLASIGCPVPGVDAQLYLCDQIFTHFERQEDITNLRSKLEDDLTRTHEILRRATADSVVVINESLNATTLNDAVVLGTAVLKKIIERELLCVYVTFVDELASLGETTVSMVATVVPDDPATRTYKIVRRPANGLAYAAALAEKYDLTYQQVKERIAS